MSDKLAIVEGNYKVIDNPGGYGDRNELLTLADRLTKVFSITCKDGETKRPPSVREAGMIASYAMSVGANPFRNEIHVWENKDGTLVMCDDYKLIVRWANTQMPFTEDYQVLDKNEKQQLNYEPDDLAVRCFVLRKDHQQLFLETLKLYIQAGIPPAEAKFEAYRVAASYSVGVVKSEEMYGQAQGGKTYKKDKKIPKGWGSFIKRAETRALRATLRISHRSPSPQEMAALTMQVHNTQTAPQDWQGVEVYHTQPERERAAQLAAWNREHQEQWAEMTEDEQSAKVAHNVEAMRGTNGDDDDPLDLSPDPLEDAPEVSPDSEDTKEAPQPEPEPPKAKNGNGGKGKLSDDVSTHFWLYVQEKKIDRQAALGIIGEFGGDMSKAFDKLQTSPELIPPDEA